MIKPYYEQDGITIYHGDCRDVLPQLEKVDLVLTDPPYGMEYNSGYYKYGNPHKAIAGDNEYPIDILEQCLTKASNAVLFFARWDNLKDVPTPKSVIAWVKNNWSAGDLKHAYGRQWECVLFYALENHKFINRPADVIDLRRVPPTELLHPTEKPVIGIQKLLQPNVGSLILDPFMGSGTTLVASKNLNRKCIGIEIEEKYCEIAVNRLRQSVMRLEI